ncbi:MULTISPECIES: hypothetical protein [unclassified Leucobacter]|uniref:hypothetical protein n=1 Tax=unclassified Leucobacter TaxID=2621730 RepID=UPI00165DD7C8|nr:MULTISPECIES: hypothetical protein [unclassified Leucobacter]MBC9935445.1 hypothetical protein [Leucobacter sp. cx-87]
MPNLTEKITGALSTLGVERSFGDPIELGDETIVPVAAVWMGLGGGASTDDAAGEGAGGGGVSLPFGAYVSSGGRTTFRPNTIVLMAVSVPLVCVAGKAISRIVRAGKRRR